MMKNNRFDAASITLGEVLNAANASIVDCASPDENERFVTGVLFTFEKHGGDGHEGNAVEAIAKALETGNVNEHERLALLNKLDDALHAEKIALLSLMRRMSAAVGYRQGVTETSLMFLKASKAGHDD